MVKYKKTYCDYYGIGEQDVVLCEYCNRVGHSPHHIKFKSKCGTDEIFNLIWLCNDCHLKAHNDKIFNKKLKQLKDKEFGL